MNPLNQFQFGTHMTTSDVLLGCRGTVGISSRQFNLVVDENLHVWLHDYHSTYGTAVGHNQQARDEIRRKETWIMAHQPASRKEGVGYESGLQRIKVNLPWFWSLFHRRQSMLSSWGLQYGKERSACARGFFATITSSNATNAGHMAT